MTMLANGSILILLAAGTGQLQSALDPVAAQSHAINRLWWFFCILTSVVYLLVLIFLFVAIVRKRREPPVEPGAAPDARLERRMTFTTGSAIGLTIIMFVLLVSDFVTGRSIHAKGDNPVIIEVTARQWWWEVLYKDNDPSQNMKTANEIHIPIGRHVRLDLAGRDVIHSFWAPNFSGKKDMIPGHPTSMWIQAQSPGEFRGQCAEYCGLQHAHMRFVIVAEPQDQFDRWLNAQRQPSVQPSTENQKRGQQVFQTGACILCHTIQGTEARGNVGPDLTHIASRPYLAAGSFPNTRDDLRTWVTNPQHLKPGVRMPQINLSDENLNALLDYLESLK